MFSNNRRTLLALAFAALAALVCPAVGSELTMGNHHVNGSNQNILTTATNNCPAGSLVVLLATYNTVADTLTGVVDSHSNTWQTPIDTNSRASLGMNVAYAYNIATQISTGDTITSTFGGSEQTTVSAVCETAALTASNPLDIHNISQNGSGTGATSISTGTLNAANEVIFGMLSTTNSPGGTVACSNSFALTNNGGLVGNNPTMCTLAVSSTASVSFAPTWVTTGGWVTDLVTFKLNSGTPTVRTLTLLGVGQ